MIEQSTSPQKKKSLSPRRTQMIPKLLRSHSWLYRNETAKDEEGRITEGSYCYCDCQTYFVVVTEVMDENKYRIFDLFEQRERISYTASLRLIDSADDFREAQQQHKTYLRNADREDRKRGR